MRDGTRWRIRGTFTTTAPMHVGSGAVVEDPRLKNTKNEQNEEFCDVQAVTTDYQGRPCIPGTAMKGVLRAWAEQCFPLNPAIDRVFGKRESGQADAEAGRAEFHTAFQPEGTTYPETHPHVPYWNATSGTGISSSVGINRVTGAAERNKLFFEEFVPEGVTFAVEVTLAKATAADVAFLLAVLEHGANHATHPYQFGASGADGWGRVTWTQGAVTAWDGKAKPPADAVGFAVCTTPARELPDPPELKATPKHERFELTLAFDGPFLVNDTSRVKRKLEKDATKEEQVQNDKRTHFTPLRRADGRVWLPASSFRGALRSRAEFLANSCGWPATRVEEVFGTTSAASRLTVAEFNQVGDYKPLHQDFVAIDRFTGGAADGAKFDATYADRPTVRTTLVLDTKELKPEAEALLAAAVRDVCRGEVTFGFGGSKGYGVATGTLCDKGTDWLQQHASGATPATGAAITPTPTVNTLRQDVLEVEPNKNPKAKPVRFLRSTRVSGEKAPWAELSKDIQENESVGTFEVEYETADGKPARIRYQGQPYLPTVTAAAKPPATTPSAKLDRDNFAHPYYFLRMEDREKFTGDLKDAPPATHAKYEHGKYSGTLRVRLTTKTPLLLCDDQNKRVCPEDNHPDFPPGTKKGHAIFPVLKDHQNKPLLASSSVRGMLRAAYEAVTNSRFGVFPFDDVKGTGHTQKLGYRPTAKSGLSTVPVRLETHNGELRARVLSGTSRIAPDGRPSKDDPMCAAWVGVYNRDWNVPSANALAHGAAGWAFVGPWEHQRGFRYWNVEVVRLGAAAPTAAPNAFRPGRQRAWPAEWAEPQWVRGWVCVTHRNIDGKHDERFFFDTGEPRYADLAPTAAADYARLIEDYQTEHADELSRGITRPPALNASCRFSRHISHESRVVATGERDLTDGTLAYAALRPDGPRWVVVALFPVMISRRLYDLAPRDLLPAKLRPATAVADLSPADRVFGWVNSKPMPKSDDHSPEAEEERRQQRAHKSLVRVGPVTCLTPTEKPPIHTFNEPQPLAILGQPKPAQGRFYLGKADGSAQENGISKELAGYTRTADEKRRNRIRGPKVYPHHTGGLAEAHWKGREKTNQNRSIREWVNDGVTFEFDLKVTNLSAVELGALVWLLSLDDGQFLRLGLGKPLGFGSVKAEVVRDESCVADGRAWAAAVPTGGRPSGIDLLATKATFKEAIDKANPRLLDAFQKSAGGLPGLKVCYPQLGNEVEHFEWFVANERESREGNGRKLALPDLTAADPSLPTRPN